MIQGRIGKKGMGFGADVKEDSKNQRNDILKHVLPEDLLHFGLIPEFVGRVPIIVTLEALDEDALIRILTEPRNALVKQYKKIFELDGVVLEFVDDTLKEIAHQALKRNTGARGLRAILEDAMLDVMFDMPSRSDIIRCVVTKEVITNRQEPLLITSEKKKRKKKEETA